MCRVHPPALRRLRTNDDVACAQDMNGAVYHASLEHERKCKPVCRRRIRFVSDRFVLTKKGFEYFVLNRVILCSVTN